MAETYSVLTRLPADARLAPAQAVELIDANFEPPVLVPSSVAVDLPGVLAPLELVA